MFGVAAPLAALDQIVEGVGTATDFDVLGDRWDVEERALDVLTAFGFTEPAGDGVRWRDRAIGALSGGEVVLLGVAALFLAEPAVLLLDEPTKQPRPDRPDPAAARPAAVAPIRDADAASVGHAVNGGDKISAPSRRCGRLARCCPHLRDTCYRGTVRVVFKDLGPSTW